MQVRGRLPYYPILWMCGKETGVKYKLGTLAHMHTNGIYSAPLTVSYGCCPFPFKYWPDSSSLSRNPRYLSWRRSGKSSRKDWKHWQCSRILQRPGRGSERRKLVLRTGYIMELWGGDKEMGKQGNRRETERWELHLQWGTMGIFWWFLLLPQMPL